MRQMLKCAADGIFERAAHDVRIKRSTAVHQVEQTRVRAAFSSERARTPRVRNGSASLSASEATYFEADSPYNKRVVRLLNEAQVIHKLRTALHAAYPLPGKGLAGCKRTSVESTRSTSLRREIRCNPAVERVVYARVSKCHRRTRPMPRESASEPAHRDPAGVRRRGGGNEDVRRSGGASARVRTHDRVRKGPIRRVTQKRHTPTTAGRQLADGLPYSLRAERVSLAADDRAREFFCVCVCVCVFV